MSNRVRWLAVGVIVVAAVVVALWPRSDDATDQPPARPGPDLAAAQARAALAPCTRAPGPVPAGMAALSGVAARCLADGSTVDLAEATGRPVLVNVWATWCEPCRAELPLLAEYAAGAGAVPVVGLAVQSPPADALDLLADLGVRFVNLDDPDGAAQRALRIPNTLPASYVIGTDGTVHFVTEPRLFRSVDQVRQTVARYLPPDGSGGS